MVLAQSMSRGCKYQLPSSSSTVVPANAGTHNHRCLLLAEAGATLNPTTKICGYGSLRSQGRRVFISVASSLSPGRQLHHRELQQQRALEHREIVVGNHGQEGGALGGDMGVDALHVVDLVAQIGIEDRGSVDQRARRDRWQRNAANADADA